MEPREIVPAPSEENKESGKEHRKRTKDLIKRVQSLLEFYFGDANLRHDRFLRREIENSPTGYIEVDLIASFNKVKDICKDRSVFIKAVKKTDALELDESEKHLRRRTPLPEPVDMDAVTVYVEYLPPYANHDWLMEVFSTCGKVEYISLPRYKPTGMIKGFAFVEYSSMDSAVRACAELNTISNGPQKRVQEDKTQIDTASDENEKAKEAVDATNKALSRGNDDDTECKVQNIDSACVDNKKRKLPCTSDSEADETSSYSSAKRSRLGASTDQGGRSTAEESDAAEENGEKRKKRKRKRKNKEEKDVKTPPLYVISKKDWKEKKALYKKLQRGGAAQFKNEVSASRLAAEQTGADALVRTTEQSPSIVADNTPSSSDKPMTVPFVKGTVLRLSTASESLAKKDVKELLARVCPVAYLDFKDGEKEGYLRLFNVESAHLLIASQNEQQNSSWPFNVTALTDGQEEAYHDKITADRKQRFSAKRKNVRGIEKVEMNRKLQQRRTAGESAVHVHFD